MVPEKPSRMSHLLGHRCRRSRIARPISLHFCFWVSHLCVSFPVGLKVANYFVAQQVQYPT